MKRKINRVGINTLTVSLPSKWAKERKLKYGDEVEVIEEGAGLLINLLTRIPEPKRISLKLESTDSEIIKSYLYGAYKLGFDEVELFFKDKVDISVVNERLKELIGFEIVSQKENFCLIKNIASPIMEGYPEMLRKYFLVTTALAEDILKVMLRKKNEQLRTVLLQEQTQNKLSLICMRLLQEHDLKLSPVPQLMHYCISETESVGDDLKYICKYYQNTKIVLDLESENYFKEFIILLREIYIFYLNPNKLKYSQIISSRNNYVQAGEKLLTNNKKGNIVLISHLLSAGFKVYDILRNLFQISLNTPNNHLK